MGRGVLQSQTLEEMRRPHGKVLGLYSTQIPVTAQSHSNLAMSFSAFRNRRVDFLAVPARARSRLDRDHCRRRVDSVRRSTSVCPSSVGAQLSVNSRRLSIGFSKGV